MSRRVYKTDIRGRAMAWLFLVCALQACILILASRTDFYTSYWEDGAIPEYSFDVADEDMNALFQAIPRALLGDLDALRLQIRDSHGQYGQAFNEREIAHMADVAGLFHIAGAVIWASGLTLAALAVWIQFGRKTDWACVMKGAQAGVLDIVVLACAIVVWALIDFQSVFWLFHQLAFTNDLWLLNPNTDRLIRLMPQAFFERSAQRIALCWAGCAALWLSVARTALCCIKKRRAKEP